MSTGGLNLSNEFFQLLKAIGESKSKQEEDRIIAKEVATLKAKMEAPIHATSSGGVTVGGGGGVNPLMSSKKRAKEFLVRLLYVEMLGHDASFGYIRAVEMAASASLYHKRTGYLVCSACLPPDHEFRFMLVNQMQRDLQSANVLEVSGGLIACTNLITSDMVPAVSSEVTKLLAHDSATIRKKSIIALYKFHQLAPEVVSVAELQDHLRRVICDKDPSVMGSSLNVIHAMACTNSAETLIPFKDLVPSFVSILKQICDHRLPSDYDYHRVPAPWMQIMLIRILGLLGKADAQASSGMYEVLADAMKKADVGINAGYAIVYECVKSIVAIYPNTELLPRAADAIARFMDSRSHNLKYLGVTGLALIVETQPQYAAQHQLAVLDCLEDADETLQRKTLDLLYRMTNPVNVEFITEKLVDFLSHSTTDIFLKQQLTTRVCDVAEKYAPNNAWYIQTITQLFQVSGDMVPGHVAQNLMSLIAEGTGDGDEEADMLLRQNAVEIYVDLLQQQKQAASKLPQILLETLAWCLGEYGYLSATVPLHELLQDMCEIAHHQLHAAAAASGGSSSNTNLTTRRFWITAILKLVTQLGTCPPMAMQVLEQYSVSRDVDVQQRCLEFRTLLTHQPALLPEIFPVDASAEDLDVDVNLSFLDGAVQSALQQGARPYEKPEDDDDDDDADDYGRAATTAIGSNKSGFNMTPYEKPNTPTTHLHMTGMGSDRRVINPVGVTLPPGAHTPPTTAVHPSANAAAPPMALNTRNVANVWGKGGVTTPATAATSSVPSTVSTTVPSSSSWDARSTTHPASSATTAAPYGAGPTAANARTTTEPPVKTAAQLERERQAAALFGGMVPGSAPPPPPPPSAVTAAAARPKPPASVSAPPPQPAVDLLDLMAWDDAPAPAPAAMMNQPDAFTPAGPPPAVETVSDDEDDGEGQAAAAAYVPVTEAPAARSVIDDDPFASAGLLGGSGLEPQPLPALMERSHKYEYNGIPMAPLPINTPQYGQQWGTCKATAPTSVQSSKIISLDRFMTLCADIGAHKVEAIAATNEGIAAGMVGAQSIALIHGKVTPIGTSTAQVDVTVKSTDAAIASSLALYMQTMLR